MDAISASERTIKDWPQYDHTSDQNSSGRPPAISPGVLDLPQVSILEQHVIYGAHTSTESPKFP